MFAERAAKRERRPKRARVMVEEEKRPGGNDTQTLNQNLKTSSAISRICTLLCWILKRFQVPNEKKKIESKEKMK